MNGKYIVRGMIIGGEWVYGYLSILDKKINYGVDVPAGYYISNEAGMPFAYAVRPETVGKPTDIKDKNRKLIFENDVVDITVHANGFSQEHLIGVIATVKYSIQKAKFYLQDIKTKSEWEFYDIMGCEVIGNIHQDSHLLGGK